MKKVLNDVINGLAHEYHIYGYDDSYDKDKVIWNADQNRWITPHVSGSGYHSICLKFTDGFKSKPLHNLLCRSFVGWQDGDCVTRHINHDRIDNRLSNLTFGTNLDNAKDRVLAGRCGMLGKSGLKTVSSKYIYTAVCEDTNVVKEYIGAKAMKEDGHNYALISAMVLKHGRFETADHIVWTRRHLVR